MLQLQHHLDPGRSFEVQSIGELAVHTVVPDLDPVLGVQGRIEDEATGAVNVSV